MRERLCSLARRFLAWERRALDRCCAPRRAPVVHGNLGAFHAGTVILTACRMRNRVIREDRDKRAAGETLIVLPDATAAVMLAAAASEAFINEFAEDIGMQRQFRSTWHPPSPPAPPLVAAADAVLDAEFRHGSTLDKYAAAARALGKPFDRGAIAFQDFRRLFKLRDALMHVHPVRPTEHHVGAQVADELAARGIALQDSAAATFAWYGRIGTADVARWACATTRAMILEIFDRLPTPSGPPDSWETIEGLYRRPLLDDETWV